MFTTKELGYSINLRKYHVCSCFLTVRTVIIRPPLTQKVIKGSSAEFYCGVSNDPTVSVTWVWRHRSLQSPNSVIITSDARRTISEDGTLTIFGVNNNDIGNYTCDVYSTGGNDTKTVSLTVMGKC